MDLQVLVNTARRELNNFERPYHWQDSELVSYAQEARNYICREIKCLIDSDPDYVGSPCLIHTVVGDLDYALSPLIIEILEDGVTLVVSSTDRRILTKTSRAEAFRTYSGWRSVANTIPTKYMLDYQTGYITLNAPVDAIYHLELSVIRYPLLALDETDLDMVLEIPEIYHDVLARYGVPYQAHLKPGENTYDLEKSRLKEAQFIKKVAGFKADLKKFGRGVEEAGFCEGAM